MNKIISVHIGGIIFHIDDHAYKKLQAYLEALNTQMVRTEGKDEIIRDIELRVAEIFQDKLKDGKTALLEKDIDDVIAIMGKPKDFEYGIAEDEIVQQEYQNKKRFFRNPDDKVLGGVCSGFAAYINADPLLVRGVFLVFVLLFGTGILLYLILWLIIPKAKTRAEKMQMRGEKIDIDSIKSAVKEEAQDLKERYSWNKKTT